MYRSHTVVDTSISRVGSFEHPAGGAAVVIATDMHVKTLCASVLAVIDDLVVPGHDPASSDSVEDIHSG